MVPRVSYISLHVGRVAMILFSTRDYNNLTNVGMCTSDIKCRSSGTWGSPDAAKVGPTSRPTSKTWIQDRRWASPSPPQRRWTSSTKTLGEEWVASGSNLSPGETPDGRRPGPVALQAAGLLPGVLSILKRIRTPTWALGARRHGLQEEGRGLCFGRWVSTHYLHLS